MEHLLLKAATTATTDQGAFEAVISTESIDREKDIVSADGMVAALRKWNRPIPLAWNHSTKAEDIFGTIDPQSVRNVGGEVVAAGQVDLESAVGKEAWRSFKSRTIGFSFGYLITQASKRKGGGRAITGLDVFEVTATPTPMNNDTRVLATKAVDSPPTATQMRILNSMAGQAQEYIASDPDAEDAQEMAQILAMIEELRGEPGTEDDDTMDDGKSIPDLSPAPAQADAQQSVDEPGAREPSEARSVDSLRKSALKLALEIRSGGVSAQPPRVKQAPPGPELVPEMDPAQLRKHTRDLMLQVLSGVETT